MRVVEELTALSEEEREAWRSRCGDPAAHTEAMTSVAALAEIEVGGAAGSISSTGESVRVVAWNVERGRHLDGITTVLRGCRPEVALLTELDVGMARSGNRHTVRELSAELGHRYTFGVEYVELGLGNRRETQRLGPEARNSVGLHGNAITTVGALSDVGLVRIEAEGAWFGADSPEPRIGGRMALTARVDIGGSTITCCTVHLESESDPALRAEQMRVVLAAIDERYGPGPAIIGGDLNTFSASIDEVRSAEGHATLSEVDPARWCWPVPYEPLFDAAADHGFSAEQANRAESTMRRSADQEPNSLLRLDWLLVRDLDVVDAQTVPAVDEDGAVLSDHDLVSVRANPR